MQECVWCNKGVCCTLISLEYILVELMPVATQKYNNGQGWPATEVKRSKEPWVEISTFLCQYAKEYQSGHIHTAMPKGKQTPHQRCLGLKPWPNALDFHYTTTDMYVE